MLLTVLMASSLNLFGMKKKPMKFPVMSEEEMKEINITNLKQKQDNLRIRLETLKREQKPTNREELEIYNARKKSLIDKINRIELEIASAKLRPNVVKFEIVDESKEVQQGPKAKPVPVVGEGKEKKEQREPQTEMEKLYLKYVGPDSKQHARTLSVKQLEDSLKELDKIKCTSTKDRKMKEDVTEVIKMYIDRKIGQV